MEEALIQWQEQELTQTGHYYKHICWMAVPLLWMSCYFYGPRPLLLCGVALLVGNLCDRLISLLRRRVYQPKDYSNESFALIIALLMPATVDWYVLVAAVLAGVLIGKEVFGGYGSYPFHPAAVGYVVAAVSWLASTSSTRLDCRRSITGWVSGSPKRQLNSMTFGLPALSIIKPAYRKPVYTLPSSAMPRTVGQITRSITRW